MVSWYWYSHEIALVILLSLRGICQLFLFLCAADEVRTMMRDTLQHLAPSSASVASASASAASASSAPPPPLPPRPATHALTSATSASKLSAAEAAQVQRHVNTLVNILTVFSE
jgi:hypothetical protein